MSRLTEAVKILIIINVVFFVGKLTLGTGVADRLFALFYFESPNFRIWQPITHMFMHGDIGHIAFNMIGLWMFGSALEAQWGSKRFLFFYFSAGLGAALIHTLVNYYQVHSGIDTLIGLGMTEAEVWELLRNTAVPGSYREITEMGIEHAQNFFTSYNTPALGASGAVYGVLVAFGMLYPNTELMLIFLPIPIKAKYFIPGLLLLDLFSGLTGFSLFGQNIANWAHLGGALFGFIMTYYWKRNSFDHTRWN
jgi:membrane associated rhomboid family serine protease